MLTDTKSHYADTNVLLDFLLSRDAIRCAKIREIFKEAQEGRVKVIVIPEVLFEVLYVLRNVYEESREKIHENLSNLLHSNHLVVQERQVLLEMIEIYKDTGLDPVDIYLYCLAKKDNCQVFSFDKDVEKLKRKF